MLTHRAEILEEIERRRFELNLGLLRVYNYYRVLVGLVLLTVFLQNLVDARLGDLHPSLFFWTTLLYTGANVVSAVTLHLVARRIFATQMLASVLVCFDILALTLLMYLSGGVSAGLGALILVAVTTGAILVPDRRATGFAAIASIAVLYEEFYLALSAPLLHDDYFQAGVLGALYFAASFAVRRLSTRLRENDVRALTQAAELADLERVNRQIIQRMRTGIVVVDPGDHLRNANQSARTLLELDATDDVDVLPPLLLSHLQAWRHNTELRIPPFQLSADGPEVRVNFFPVRADDPHGDVTIFIEDTGEIQQQAQQLKLAALGRLSASIAHEIRNPLSAINHAAQLLNESSNLDKGDSRLLGIITSHCQRMNGVIENVLEMSRRRLPTPVKLALLSHLESFLESFAATTPGAQIELEVDPPGTEVRMDRIQLDQVLTNLISNALRHSCEHSGTSWVRIEGGIDARTERPYLNIIDHGAGVPESQLEHLFEPFFTTAREGTGLGLYISRELCEANQARLSYLPQADGGSCFRITFAHPDRIVA
ncbi:MAG: HAMP domain-containing sensor histidine kinase [Pseudomonadales bacterium]